MVMKNNTQDFVTEADFEKKSTGFNTKIADVRLKITKWMWPFGYFI